MIKFKNEKELVDYAYKEYIKYWMKKHDMDESEFMTYLVKYWMKHQFENKKNFEEYAYHEYIKDWKNTHDCTDDECLYVCKNEFFDNEYQDEDIMKDILCPEMFEFYLNIRSTKK